MNKVDIFIVSYARDFQYLKYCLRSIDKFAHGFRQVHLVIPDRDIVALYRETEFEKVKRGEWSIHLFDEWEGKGMLHHMYLEMMADKYCQGADFVLHMDSDCVFIESVSPDDYFVDDKPTLLHASYQWLCYDKRPPEPELLNWQRAVESALGWKPEHEFMRCHPAVHYIRVYEKARESIECYTQVALFDYIRKGRNGWPQEFAEYPTLGEVAWKFFHPLYNFHNEQFKPRPKPKIKQLWSHIPPTAMDMELFQSLGLL